MLMKKSDSEKIIPFIFSVTAFHVITYFIAGIIASSVFNYKQLFALPIIADYFKPTESQMVYLGPLIQIIRGLLFALVLLPFRQFLKANKNGWLLLWSVFLVFGIINTPAASPASIEGIIYTKLPLWFHLIGMSEIVLQTLVFSLLVHRKLCPENYRLPEYVTAVIDSLSVTCISFFGYTVVSILFAFAAKADIDQTEVNIKILGQFIAPLAGIFICAMTGTGKIILKHFVLYAVSALSILIYGKIILGSAELLYALSAPILPVIISFLLMNRKRKTGDVLKTQSDTD